MKECTGCKVTKPFSEFSKNSKAKDGLMHKCNPCRKEYYQLNKERWAVNSKKWREDNKERNNEINKSYDRQDGYGVYILIHIPTQKYYIGKGLLFVRKNLHLNTMKKGENTCGYIQEHYNKDPYIGDWEFRTIKKWDLDIDENKTSATELEMKYIQEGFDKNPKYILNKTL